MQDSSLCLVSDLLGEKLLSLPPGGDLWPGPQERRLSLPTYLRISLSSQRPFSLGWQILSKSILNSMASKRSEWTWLGPEALWDLQEGELYLCLGSVGKSGPNPKCFLIIMIMTLFVFTAYLPVLEFLSVHLKEMKISKSTVFIELPWCNSSYWPLRVGHDWATNTHIGCVLSLLLNNVLIWLILFKLLRAKFFLVPVNLFLFACFGLMLPLLYVQS